MHRHQERGARWLSEAEPAARTLLGASLERATGRADMPCEEAEVARRLTASRFRLDADPPGDRLGPATTCSIRLVLDRLPRVGTEQ